MSDLADNWTTTPLGELVTPAGSKAGEMTDAPVYSVTKHAGFVPSEEYFSKQVYGRDLSSYRLVHPGEFAYATIHLDEGSIGIAPERALISPMYTAFRADTSQIDSQFLLHYLKSPRALARYELLGSGSVHRRRSISLKRLNSLPVPLPPLPEQRRIAAILDKAHTTHQLAEQLVTLCDKADLAIFERFFKSTPRTRLGDVADFHGGISLPEGSHFDGQDQGFLLIRVSDMNSPGNERVLTSASSWTSIVGPRSATVPARSVILPKRGGAIGTNKKRLLGRAGIIDPNLMGISADTTSILPEVLYHWLLSFDLSSITSGSTVPQLNKKDLKDLEVPCPPLGEQKEFAATAVSIDSLRQRALARKRSLDALQSSLKSRAFQGEL